MRLVLENVNEFSKRMAKQLVDHKHILLFGSGLGEAVASEGALKMKELTYIHCQAFALSEISGSVFSFAKLATKTATIFVVLDSDQESKNKALSHMAKLLEHGINLLPIVITDCRDTPTKQFFEHFCGSADNIFYVPRSGSFLSALLCVVPLQRLAYDITIALGYDPDRPRNLAKELTTH
jgi:glutamine---fructose-6-phosphate transaminase (isomerizing)